MTTAPAAPPRLGAVDPDIDVEIEARAWADALPDAADLARRAAAAALGASTARGGVAILLTDDDAMRDLNARFRGRDAPTNVLAFPGLAPPVAATAHLGDIAVAFGVCLAEARAQDKPLADHLTHLVVHGVLHLLGHDHREDTEAEAMEARERELLAAMGVPDPYRPRPGEAATDLARADG
jgi:probable rRNA maturation factor